MPEKIRPLPFRRMVAGLIDNALIIGWACLIAAVSLSLGGGTMSVKWLGYLLALSTLTLPVVVVFALFEATGRHATPGKRLLGLEVAGIGAAPGFARLLMRNVLKFLPWELAHIGIWLTPGQPFVEAPGIVGWSFIFAGELLALVWLAGLFIGTGRPVHDRLVQTCVLRRARPA